jgi:hypothetical protein
LLYLASYKAHYENIGALVPGEALCKKNKKNLGEAQLK